MKILKPFIYPVGEQVDLPLQAGAKKGDPAHQGEVDQEESPRQGGASQKDPTREEGVDQEAPLYHRIAGLFFALKLLCAFLIH